MVEKAMLHRTASLPFLLAVLAVMAALAACAPSTSASSACENVTCDLRTHFVASDCQCKELTVCQGPDVETVRPTPTSDRQCGYADDIDCSLDGDWLLPEARGLYTTRYSPRPQTKQEPREFVSLNGRFHIVLRSPEQLPFWVHLELGDNEATLPAWYVLEPSVQRVHAYWEATTPDKPDQILALTPQHMPYKPARVVFYEDDVEDAGDDYYDSANQGW